MTTTAPDQPAEDSPGGGSVQMTGTAHDNSTLIQVAGDQYNIRLPPPPPAPATFTLPADTPAFTGRAQELHTITTAVTAAAEAGRVVAIHAIDGMPGVGKTALAVHAGHRLAEKFPDRQLFLDLHAHTPGRKPTDPVDALAGLLTADGVDPRYLPDTLDDRAALWRNRMAHKQVLLILDNAATSTQVTPLLPGSAGCLVLITSRRYLGDLPAAVPVPLDILSPEEARQMFLRLAPRADDPDRVAELVALCGYLPLAISLLARLFSTHRSWTLDQLITETTTRLLTVTAENRTVAAAFDLSYQHLPSDRQHFFRHLGLHPGTDFDAYSAAALTNQSLPQAVAQLDALYCDHLLDEPVYRRYRMHDLIRDYIRILADTDPAIEREQALDRVLDYYQHTAARADAHLARRTRPPATTPTTAPAAAPELTRRDQAQAWLRAERATLLACLQHATGHAQHARVVALTAGLVALLRDDGPWTQALDLHTTAAAAARHLGDRLGEATTLCNLGDARFLTGDYPGATQAYDQALSLFRDLDDRLGEAGTLNNLGTVRRVTGDYPGATQALEQALGLFRDLGDRLGEAKILHNLGTVRGVTGDYPGATQALEQALGLYRDLGDRLGEASSLGNLGNVRQVTGDYPGAAETLEQALGLYRDLGYRPGEANALGSLGNVRRETGDYPGAAQAYEQALCLFRDLGNRPGEANTLGNMGNVRREIGDYSGAAQAYEQVLGLFRGLGDRFGEANALNNLGNVRQVTGDYPGAAQAHQQALGLYRDIGNRPGEVEVLNEWGTLCLKSGDAQQALASHRQALEFARTLGIPLEQARAIEGTGRCALATGDAATAVTELRQALAIYQRLGVAEATQLAADLAELDTE